MPYLAEDILISDDWNFAIVSARASTAGRNPRYSGITEARYFVVMLRCILRGNCALDNWCLNARLRDEHKWLANGVVTDILTGFWAVRRPFCLFFGRERVATSKETPQLWRVATFDADKLFNCAVRTDLPPQLAPGGTMGTDKDGGATVTDGQRACAVTHRLQRSFKMS